MPTTHNTDTALVAPQQADLAFGITDSARGLREDRWPTRASAEATLALQPAMYGPDARVVEINGGVDEFDEPNGSPGTVSAKVRKYSAQWGLPELAAGLTGTRQPSAGTEPPLNVLLDCGRHWGARKPGQHHSCQKCAAIAGDNRRDACAVAMLNADRNARLDGGREMSAQATPAPSGARAVRRPSLISRAFLRSLPSAAQTAQEHRDADARCERAWVCQCGSCRIERDRLKLPGNVPR